MQSPILAPAAIPKAGRIALAINAAAATLK